MPEKNATDRAVDKGDVDKASQLSEAYRQEIRTALKGKPEFHRNRRISFLAEELSYLANFLRRIG